ncbi:MAG: hypothetical protein ABGY75_22510 [Gemmataceae bacterium]
MPSVSCPSCSARVKLSASSGNRLRCPECGERFAVPDEDDEDERPRRYRPAKGGLPVWIFMAGGAAVTLVIVLVVLAMVLNRGKGGKGVDPLAVFDSPPEGYGTVRDSSGGFRVYLPGQPRKIPDAERVVWASTTGGGFGTPMTVFGVMCAPLPAGTKPGPPEEFEKLLQLADPSYEGGKTDEVVSRKLATLDGRPSLEIRTREHPEFFRKEPPPPPAEFEKRTHTIYYVTTNGKRVAVIKVRLTGTFTDERMLRTIAESFSFL